ncbi:MAG: hypothetical protein WA056_05255 [Gallionella sp.]|nr:hypothetical protein [Gallionella sp.]MCK9355454.1 hypothetical protein [Gallionella sp.]
MGMLYKTTMSANSTNRPNVSGNIEGLHTSDEIIHRANEILTQQMGLELHSFAGLREVEIPADDGDLIYYVDQSGNRVEFTEELQLVAAIAVLNSKGHYFEATPTEEGMRGFA